jgi:hypothetical protein
MSKISIAGAATGTATFTIESPATSTNRTLTLPDNTGTILTNATAGTVLQVIQAVQTNALILNNNNTYTDVTGLSASITPTSASNKILVLVNMARRIRATQAYFEYNGLTNLVRNSTQIAERVINLGAGNGAGTYTELSVPGLISYLDSPNTTSSTTYKVQIRGSYTTVDTTDACSANSTITLMEIAA